MHSSHPASPCVNSLNSPAGNTYRAGLSFVRLAEAERRWRGRSPNRLSAQVCADNTPRKAPPRAGSAKKLSVSSPAVRTRKISGRQTFRNEVAIKARFQRGFFKMTFASSNPPDPASLSDPLPLTFAFRTTAVISIEICFTQDNSSRCL